MKLFVHEIFRSIQGEAHTAGWPTIFVRLSGCNLRCLYCDTEYAWDADADGETEVDAVRSRVRALGDAKQNHVLITGGEPLLQKQAVCALAEALIRDGYAVSLETNGSHLADALPEKLIAVIDVKTPGSGMSGVMNHENFRRARRHHDIFKFVLTSEADLTWTFDCIERHHLEHRYDVYLSPAAEGGAQPKQGFDARALAEAILASGKRVRLNLQLHKLIWDGDTRGR
jgi:7-carboxy-7-deazaguanine synthase